MANLMDFHKYSWLVILSATFMYLTITDAFEYSAYCESQCKIGRGGNLCRCNAVHFAGKRTLDTDKLPAYNGVYEKVPGYAKDNGDIASILSYLISGSSKAQGKADYSEEVGEDEEFVMGDKRYSSDRTMPFRSWYREMKELMKSKAGEK